MEEKKAVSIMSKKRYHLIEETLRKTIDDPNKLANVLQSIQEIMNFDPNRNTYTPEVKERVLQWRKKKAEELGVTTYVTSGSKACYERKKQSPTYVKAI